jgi:hypothetical protein
MTTLQTWTGCINTVAGHVNANITGKNILFAPAVIQIIFSQVVKHKQPTKSCTFYMIHTMQNMYSIFVVYYLMAAASVTYVGPTFQNHTYMKMRLPTNISYITGNNDKHCLKINVSYITPYIQ